MTTSRRKILSVGQCDHDDGLIRRAMTARYPVEIVSVDTADEAVHHAQMGGYDLVLVNRVFDADEGNGIDLIRTLRSDAGLSALPVMLVSNLADAQAEAVGVGAVVGFGKSALTAAATYAALDPYLGPQG